MAEDAKLKRGSGLPFSTFFSPEALAVLAAAGATAELGSMPLILVPGVLAYGILTFFRYSRWREKASDPYAPLVVDVSGVPARHLAGVTQCVALADRSLQEIASAEPTHRAMLAPSVDRVRGLAESAARLSRKIGEIDAHLDAGAVATLDRDARSLEQRIASSHDQRARQGYQRALDQHRQKVDALRALQARGERLDAQLTNVKLTLETVSAQIARIKSADTDAATVEGQRIAEALDALSIDMDAAVETIDEDEESFPEALKKGQN